MTFKAQLTSDLDIFFNSDEFAVESEYLPGSAAETVPVRAIWDFAPESGSGRGLDLDTHYSQGAADYAEVRIPAADLDARPEYLDRIYEPDDTDPWYVQQPRYADGEWILPVNRNQKGDFRG